MNIEKLWNEKKWLFFLLLPVIIVVGAVQLLAGYQKGKANEAMDDARSKDDELDDKVREKEKEIVETETEIKESEKRREERDPEDVPLDWHKHTDE